MIQLRELTQNDIPALLLYGHSQREDVELMLESCAQKQFEGRFFNNLGVVDDGKLVGTVSIYEHSPYAVEVGPEIFEAYRRQGVATVAVKLALDIAKQKGYRVAQAQIARDNIPAIELHKKLGFETDGYLYKNRRNKACLLFLLPL